MSENNFVSTDQAIDLLPYVVDIYEKIDMDGYRKKLTAENKDKTDVDQQQIGIDALKYIVKNASKIKSELFNVVAIVERKDPNDIKNQSFIKTLKSVKQIFSDDELVDFFKQAMQ